MTNDDKLIADQAKQLWAANERIKSMEHALEAIKKSLMCIGGPLNDNVLQYSKEQLDLFFKIRELVNEGLYD